MSNTGDFTRAADCFVELLGRIPAERWTIPVRPGGTADDAAPVVAPWDVRGLAGHTARAILTVENYLSHDEPSAVGIPSAEAYYSTVYPTLHDGATIDEDGIIAGTWLADDAKAHVSAAIANVAALLDAQPPDRAVSIGGMGIPLAEYLRTRVVELVLHTIDLSRATGVDHSLPAPLVAEAARLVASVRPHLRHGESRLLDAEFVSAARAGTAVT